MLAAGFAINLILVLAAGFSTRFLTDLTMAFFAGRLTALTVDFAPRFAVDFTTIFLVCLFFVAIFPYPIFSKIAC
jgi:hypothetical protein